MVRLTEFTVGRLPLMFQIRRAERLDVRGQPEREARPYDRTAASFPRPRVLYATSREATYARNQTLVRALCHYADVEVVAPAGDGQGFDRRIAYVWGLVSVVVRVLVRALHPTRSHDTLVLGFLAQPLAVVLRPFWRGRVIADAMMSVYDTICLDKQLAAPDSTLGRIARWLDLYLIHHTDALIFDTQQHREYFRTLTTDALPLSCVVPVGARKVNDAGRATSGFDRLQVVFAGSYIPLQGSRVIVDAAQLLKDEPVDFTMIGTGQEFAATSGLARARKLLNIRFIGWVGLDVLDGLYHRADVILGIFGHTAKAQRVIPNKVFEALSIGQPVITGDTPAVRELLVPGRDVMCCPTDDPVSLAEAIRWVNTHREQAHDIGRAGQIAFERHASDRALAAALRTVFARSES